MLLLHRSAVRKVLCLVAASRLWFQDPYPLSLPEMGTCVAWRSARLAPMHLAQCCPCRVVWAIGAERLCQRGLISGYTGCDAIYGTCLLGTNDLEGHGANIFNARVQSFSVFVTVRCGEKMGIQKLWFCCKKPVSSIPCTLSTATLWVSYSFAMQLTFPACLVWNAWI